MMIAPRRGSWQVLSGLLTVAVVSACGGEPTPGIARGQALYDTCVPCHGADGGGDRELAAPAIAGLPQWYVERQLHKYRAGFRGAAPYDTSGIRMKSMSLTLDLPGDVESVSEFVASMAPATPDDVLAGDAAAGQRSYQTCMACHGPDGMGNELVGAPPLVGHSDWYVVAQLEKFRSGWRGTNPADTFGVVMRPNSLILDDAAMLNVSAYIESLR